MVISWLLELESRLLLTIVRNFVMVESKNILVDNIYLSSTSDDYQVGTYLLGNFISGK